MIAKEAMDNDHLLSLLERRSTTPLFLEKSLDGNKTKEQKNAKLEKSLAKQRR